jgi:hypothetical protein
MDINFAADPTVMTVAGQHAQLAARTANLRIIDAEAFQQTAQWLKEIRTAMREIDDAEERIKRPLMEALGQVRSQAAAARAPYLDTKGKIDAAILAWNREQDRLRRIAQDKADREAKAEKDRLQAISDRAAAESRRKAQEQREAADKAAAEGRQAEADRLAAAAAKTEEKGQAKADQFQARADTTVAQVVQADTPKVSGVQKRDNWTYRLKDKTKLNEPFKMADESKILKTVKSLKLEALAVIGEGAVEIFNDPIIASGRA